ncbi:cyclophilin-like fold protein [Enterococcus sp. HY326]|uniref:cyclophilin-like fold protein n=1 Tax=Enterococcus sp. HY326 TaxID=2971265 RepID=UPI0022405505|nr:cyclophilin-like fold protein [Enterococcus sp. HY326]
MKNKLISIGILFVPLLLTACNTETETVESSGSVSSQVPTTTSESSSFTETTESTENTIRESLEEETMSEIPVKILVQDQELDAIFYNNDTTQALLQQFPLTLPMMDLYSREMCYRFEEDLPASQATTSGYQVGDIAYWTPRHSFVIFYEQNNEVISNLQIVGHIASGVELFATTGDTDVTFEVNN